MKKLMNIFDNIFTIKNTKKMNYIFDKWILKNEKNNLKANTIKAYRSSINAHLRPFFGKMRITNVQTATVQDFINQLAKKSSPKTVREHHNHLKSAFEMAIKMGIITKNPCTNTILPVDRREKGTALSWEERLSLEFKLKGKQNALDISLFLGLYLGLRLSEVAALRWCDIDFKQAIIHINHSVERFIDEYGRTKTRLGTPKTNNSIRVIPIPSYFKHILMRYFNECSTHKKGAECFVVGKSDGTAYSGRTLERYAKKIFEQAGISKAHTFHSLRHTFATQALEKKMDIKVLSSILGHSRTTTTMDIYQHLNVQYIKREMEKINEASQSELENNDENT